MYEYKLAEWTEHMADLEGFINTMCSGDFPWSVHTFSVTGDRPYATATVLFYRLKSDGGSW